MNLHFTVILGATQRKEGATLRKEGIEKMIEILEQCFRFKTTYQRVADQVRMIIKKCWFSDLET